MKYVGLTDDPETRKEAHGNPSDWWQRSFSTEKEARQWEKERKSNEPRNELACAFLVPMWPH